MSSLARLLQAGLLATRDTEQLETKQTQCCTLQCGDVASFPGLPTVQFLIACSMQKLLQVIKNWMVGRPGNEASGDVPLDTARYTYRNVYR